MCPKSSPRDINWTYLGGADSKLFRTSEFNTIQILIHNTSDSFPELASNSYHNVISVAFVGLT